MGSEWMGFKNTQVWLRNEKKDIRCQARSVSFGEGYKESYMITFLKF